MTRTIILFTLTWIFVAPALGGYRWNCEAEGDNYQRWTVQEEEKDLAGNEWLLVTRRHPTKRRELKIEPGSAKKIRNSEEPIFQVMFDGNIEVLSCAPGLDLNRE